MKKILLAIILSAATVFAYEDDGAELADESSQATEIDSVVAEESDSTQAQVSEQSSDVVVKKPKAAFYGEAGFLIAGLGLRLYVGQPRKNYMQMSLQYDMGYIRSPIEFFIGGEHWHGIVGGSINFAYSGGGSPQLLAWVVGANYDINRHVGFNLKLTSLFNWPSETPSTVVADVQFAF